MGKRGPQPLGTETTTTTKTILRWYCLPRPSFVKLVELRGLALERTLQNATESEVLAIPPSHCSSRNGPKR